MLSSSVIKNVSHAGHYFSEQDNYYTREEGVEKSEWWGKGAEKLQLSGNVSDKQFTEMLQGKLPTDEQLGKMVNNEIKHRPGWDLTFSAPKSVSILAFIGGDKRLIEAHRQSVHVALAQIERSCAQARVKNPDGIAYQNTGNLIAALHHHDLSRAKDPQLHTHSVVMNMTERDDGKWRSLASQIGRYNEQTQGEVNGFIERVRHHNRFFSKIYETELAYRVKQLGYEITTDTKSGIFEIVDVPKQAIQFYSKRRAQIEKQLEQKGLSGGKAAGVATLNTRDAKEEVNRVILKEKWEQESKELGLDCKKIIEDTYKTEKHFPAKFIDQEALNAIKQATKSLSVFQATFTLEEVVTRATDYAIKNSLNIESLLLAVEEQIANKELLQLSNELGKTLLMSKHTIDAEKRLFEHLQDNKSAKSIIDKAHLESYLKQHPEIDKAYYQGIDSVFGNERIVILEGEVTRDTLISPIVNIAKSVGLEIALLSPSVVGSKQFAKNIKQEPQTFWEHIKALFVDHNHKHYSVMQFLSKTSENKLPHLLIVDNAQLLSTYQKEHLIEWNKTHSTKLILLGNKATLLSQQMGASLQQLNEKGVPSISLRSKDEPNFHSVINKISERIIEVKSNDERHHVMANHYCKISNDERKNSWLVTHTKKSVEELNVLTHENLLKEDKLSKPILVKTLIPIYVSDGKGIQANTYKKNYVVRFNEKYSSLNVDRGEYLRVLKSSKFSNRVVLQKDNGQHVVWQPDKVAGGTAGKIELFAEKEREFCIGETITFNRSLKSKDIVKGERLTIDNISQQKIKLKNNEGKSVGLDLTKAYHRHVEYGYAATLHTIAHEKPFHLIAELPSFSYQTDQRYLNQTISQAKETWIYTDDHQKLITQLENKTGDRLTAHQILSNAEELKKNLHSLYEILEKKIEEKTGRISKVPLSRKAVEAITYSMNHLAEREAGFTHKQLLETAIEHALGSVNQESLTQATIAMEKAGILLRGNKNDGTIWTTADAVKVEREILAFCNQDKGSLLPIANDELLDQYCNPNKLNQEQITAVKAITQSKDRVIVVQGHPGSGKTTMLATVADVLAAKDLLTSQGYNILGLAPTHTAVKELLNRKIPAQTLDSFITKAKHSLEKTKQDHTILVIDEASMVSNRKMLEVLKIAHKLEYRGIILIGDNRQLPSIEAGKPQMLMQSQVKTVHLTEIARQKDAVLKKAVKETIAFDYKAAFKTLKDSIIEVPINTENGKEKKLADIRTENRLKRLEILVNRVLPRIVRKCYISIRA